MNKYILTLLSFLITLPVLAYEDCIITTNGKLTDIKIQHNDIVDVFPLTTIMNDKNTLIIHPLKDGATKFTVIKNNKDKFLFSVKVTDEQTEINANEGFEVITIDCPPGAYEYYFNLDEPPETENSDTSNNNYGKFLDKPPVLREEL